MLGLLPEAIYPTHGIQELVDNIRQTNAQELPQVYRYILSLPAWIPALFSASFRRLRTEVSETLLVLLPQVRGSGSRGYAVLAWRCLHWRAVICRAHAPACSRLEHQQRDHNIIQLHLLSHRGEAPRDRAWLLQITTTRQNASPRVSQCGVTAKGARGNRPERTAGRL